MTATLKIKKMWYFCAYVMLIRVKMNSENTDKINIMSNRLCFYYDSKFSTNVEWKNAKIHKKALKYKYKKNSLSIMLTTD